MIPRLVVSTAIVLGLLVAAVIGTPRSPAPQPVARPMKPANPAAQVCQDAIERVYRGLPAQNIDALLDVERNGVIHFHHGWGTGIRNDLGLWKPDSPIRKSCAALEGHHDVDPEHASSVIMKGVWDLVHAENDLAEPRCCGRIAL